jgi:spore germination protein YaaH
VAVAAPAADPAWDLAAYGRAADLVLLMDYDEHWGGGPPGPIASNAWFDAAAARAASAIPPGKLIIGLAVYGCDWSEGAPSAYLSEPEAVARAHMAGVDPKRDPISGNMTFSYLDQGRRHEVWYMDAASSQAQIALARGHGARNFAFWRLGLEAPALWTVFGRQSSRP